jgi:large subunit ribosomal protein L4
MTETKKTTTKKTEKRTEVKLNPSVWEVPYNADLVAQAYYIYSTNERKGSARQKGRGDVSGGGKKPWKQKGTGRARHGSIRSPLWVGGGVTFANTGRNFSRRLNKKMARKATSIMLSERLRNKELEFVKVTATEAKKIRNGNDKRVLFVTEDDKVALLLRNSKNTEVKSPDKLNAKHLILAKKILVDEKAVKVLEDRLLNGK